MKILITGATGFVGKQLVSKLLTANHEIVILSRDKSRAEKLFSHANVTAFSWPNHLEIPPQEAFQNINGIINLMGENIGGKRWSPTQKEILKSSRITATENLVKRVMSDNLKLDFFISASATGIYPANTKNVLTETSPEDHSFLAKLCQDWENASLPLNSSTKRVLIRTGVVLDKSDGALKKMLPPFYLGAGGILGDGSQLMSWIHVDDLVNIYIEAINNKNMQGAFNAVAPNPVSNLEFTKALGHAIHRPTLFPVPKAAIKLLFGEMSAIILDSQKVIPERLNHMGFQFCYPTIEQAMAKIFN